jgi:diguanylate cyclase (GGDEF)-like protein
VLAEIEDLGAVQDVQVEILWGLGRLDDARHVLEDRIVAGHVSVAAERQVRWDHVQLGVEHRRMALLSESDPLTGLRNRRSLERTMPDLLASGAPLVVGVVDLDGFKQVNDQLGYARGDAVIREVADLLEGMCRRGDLVVRLGGDEFVLVLREIDAQGAARVFERVRKLLDVSSTRSLSLRRQRCRRRRSRVGIASRSSDGERQRRWPVATSVQPITRTRPPSRCPHPSSGRGPVRANRAMLPTTSPGIGSVTKPRRSASPPSDRPATTDAHAVPITIITASLRMPRGRSW